MKKLLCILSALLLCACTAAAPAGSDAAEALSTAEPAPAREMHRLSTLSGGSPGQGGYYHIYQPDDADYALAAVIDPATGQDRVLCSRSGCAHNEESCPAFFVRTTEDSPYISSNLYADGDKLYWLRTPMGNQISNTNDAFLDVSDLDGSNRRRIVAGGVIPLYLSIGCYGNGESLFCSYRCGSYFAVYRFNENGVKAIYERQSTQQVLTDIIGVWQDKLLLSWREDYVTPDYPPEGSSEELWSAWDEACRAAMKQAPLHLAMLDADGNFTDTGLILPAESCEVYPVQGDSLYALEHSGCRWRYDLAANTVEELEPMPAIEGDYWVYGQPYGAWVTGSYFTPGQDDYTEYWLNLADGSYLEPQPTWLKDESVPRIPYTVAALGDTLLMEIGCQYYDTTTTGQDGQPYTFTTSRYTYGLIPAKDFLAGSQNWTPVTLLGNDLI